MLARKLVGLVVALYCCSGAASFSQDQHLVTTFGAERRARWSLEGKTALVTGGTKVMWPLSMGASSFILLPYMICTTYDTSDPFCSVHEAAASASCCCVLAIL